MQNRIRDWAVGLINFAAPGNDHDIPSLSSSAVASRSIGLLWMAQGWTSTD
jgi:hypothetical protein